MEQLTYRLPPSSESLETQCSLYCVPGARSATHTIFGPSNAASSKISQDSPPVTAVHHVCVTASIHTRVQSETVNIVALCWIIMRYLIVEGCGGA